MRTEEISTFEDLTNRIYRKESGTICHFTSFESLILILKNRSLRMSRIDLLNDRAEKQLSECEEGELRFVTSFTGTAERVAMWAIYGGHSSLKLRLSFPRSILIQSVSDQFYFDSLKEHKITSDFISKDVCDYSKKEFSLSDVVYFDKTKNRLRFNGRAINGIPVTDDIIKKLAGNIKYDAWEFENETRLSVILKQNGAKFDLSNIYANISEELLDTLVITYNPWIEDTVYNAIKRSLDEIAGRKLKHSKSSIHGEVGEL